LRRTRRKREMRKRRKRRKTNEKKDRHSPMISNQEEKGIYDGCDGVFFF